MTTPVHADPRRSGAPANLGFSESAAEGSALEMPVLFQLSDLSQQKILSPPARQPKPQRQSAPQAVEAAAEPAASQPEPAKPAGASTEAASPPPAQDSDPVAASDAPVAKVDSPLLAASAAAAQPSLAASSDSPTIRERAQLRERRRQAATQGDWFQTQGKYILVVFAVLLVGTIYLARRGGDDSPPPPALEPHDLAADAQAAQTPADEPAAAEPQLADQGDQAAGPEEIYPAVSPSPAAPTLADLNPAEATSPAAEAGPPLEFPTSEGSLADAPQVTLQAPVHHDPAPPATTEGSLFPWASQPEARVATRPQADGPGTSVPLPQANPHFPARPSSPGGPTVAPPQHADAPPASYPSTGFDGAPVPGGALPGEGTAPAAYPVAEPGMNHDSSVRPPRREFPAGVMPASYDQPRVSSAPRTSGPRYERTGSGLY